MITKEQLKPRVLVSIRPFLGHLLQQVTYACLLHEANADQLLAPDFYFGGEVVMQFDGTREPLIISWDENAGWEDHFSIQDRTTSAFKTGSLEPFDASRTSIWNPHIKQPLNGFEILGFENSPQIIVLQFFHGDVFVGCGWKTTFGDGDDILVRSKETVNHNLEMITLYKEGNT